MKKLLILAIALPFALFPIAGCAHRYPSPGYAPPPPSVVARHGLDDGVAAARTDMAHGLRPNVNRHPRFRNPPVPPGQPAAIYRENFHRGYNMMYRRRR